MFKSLITRHYITRILLFLLILLLNISILQGLNPDKSFHHYVQKHYAVEEGLPQNSIFSITQTHDGYLWFGSGEGILRFNGKEFTVYNHQNTSAISDLYIWKLFTDSTGTLWAAMARGGIVYYKDEHFKKLPLQHKKIREIMEDSEGAIWIGTRKNGVIIYKDGKFTHITRENGLPHNRCSALFEDRHKNIWIGTNGGLTLYKNGIQKTFTTADGLSGNNITEIYEDSAGNLWIGTYRKGLNLLRNGEFIQITTDDGLSNNTVTSILEDSHKNIWVGTHRGLNLFQQRKLQNIKLKKPFSQYRIQALFEDREENLWVGTDGGGIYQFYDGDFTSYNREDGMRGEIAFGIMEDKNGTIWSGSYKGVNILKNDTFQHLTTEDGLQSPVATTFLEHEDGRIFIGNVGGISIYDNGSFKPFKHQETFAEKRVVSLLKDTDGSVWISTLFNGIYHIKNEKLTTYSPKDYNFGSELSTILIDRNHDLWIASTDLGLIRLKNGKITTYSKDEGLSSNHIYSLYEDKTGNLWMGTYGYGLNLYRNGEITSFNKIDESLPNVVHAIIEDDHGNLWMSSSHGVFKVSIKELLQYADSKKETIHAVRYDMKDGMLSRECVGGVQGTAIKDHKGRLWFSTIKGITMVDPDKLLKNDVPPPIVIEKVVVDGTLVSQSDQNILQPGAQKIVFHVAGLSYIAPKTVKFKYRLIGETLHWSSVTAESRITYINPEPGPYQFEVLAENNSGVWSDKPATFSFYIPSYFYNSLWFKIIAVVFGFAILITLFHIKLSSIKAKNRELSEKLRQKQEAAKDKRMLTDESLSHLDRLLTYMDKEKPYQNPDINIAMIAQALGITTLFLSEIINMHMNYNFKLFINNYRISEVKEKLSDPAFDDEKIISIALNAGFNTKGHFNYVFKKFTGLTPKEFRHKQRMKRE